MNAEMSKKVNEKIILTLDHCISKMADALKKTFDLSNNSTVSLFKSFCSAVKTRAAFMKSIEKQVDNTIKNIEKVSKILNSQPNQKSYTKPVDFSALSFTPPKKNGKKYQNPLKPEDLLSGLLLK